MTLVKCILCTWSGDNTDANHDDVVPACPSCGGRVKEVGLNSATEDDNQ